MDLLSRRNPAEGASVAAWPHTIATVTTCAYRFGAGRALAFGLPTTRHFRITFQYAVAGELHTGEFSSRKPVPQGTRFPLTYNPDRPRENEMSTDIRLPARRTPALVLGVIGSVVLSLLWLMILRGCR